MASKKKIKKQNRKLKQEVKELREELSLVVSNFHDLLHYRKQLSNGNNVASLMENGIYLGLTNENGEPIKKQMLAIECVIGKGQSRFNQLGAETGRWVKQSDKVTASGKPVESLTHMTIDDLREPLFAIVPNYLKQYVFESKAVYEISKFLLKQRELKEVMDSLIELFQKEGHTAVGSVQLAKELMEEVYEKFYDLVSAESLTEQILDNGKPCHVGHGELRRKRLDTSRNIQGQPNQFTNFMNQAQQAEKAMSGVYSGEYLNKLQEQFPNAEVTQLHDEFTIKSKNEPSLLPAVVSDKSLVDILKSSNLIIDERRNFTPLVIDYIHGLKRESEDIKSKAVMKGLVTKIKENLSSAEKKAIENGNQPETYLLVTPNGVTLKVTKLKARSNGNIKPFEA